MMSGVVEAASQEALQYLPSLTMQLQLGWAHFLESAMDFSLAMWIDVLVVPRTRGWMQDLCIRGLQAGGPGVKRALCKRKTDLSG